MLSFFKDEFTFYQNYVHFIFKEECNSGIFLSIFCKYDDTKEALLRLNNDEVVDLFKNGINYTSIFREKVFYFLTY